MEDEICCFIKDYGVFRLNHLVEERFVLGTDVGLVFSHPQGTHDDFFESLISEGITQNRKKFALILIFLSKFFSKFVFIVLLLYADLKEKNGGGDFTKKVVLRPINPSILLIWLPNCHN